jgi:hypothetical protein
MNDASLPEGNNTWEYCVRDQRRITKRPGSGTKTTAGVENKFATRLRSPLVADLKLIFNLVFFISFFSKRIKTG